MKRNSLEKRLRRKTLDQPIRRTEFETRASVSYPQNSRPRGILGGSVVSSQHKIQILLLLLSLLACSVGKRHCRHHRNYYMILYFSQRHLTFFTFLLPLQSLPLTNHCFFILPPTDNKIQIRLLPFIFYCQLFLSIHDSSRNYSLKKKNLKYTAQLLKYTDHVRNSTFYLSTKGLKIGYKMLATFIHETSHYNTFAQQWQRDTT